MYRQDCDVWAKEIVEKTRVRSNLPTNKKIQLSAALRQMEGQFELAAQTLKNLHKLVHSRLIKVSTNRGLVSKETVVLRR